MLISEIYKSVQGEGLLTSTESVFIRTTGCNLRCWFCDTPYASWQPEGHHWSLDSIVARVKKLDCSHVVITGGEPMLPRDIVHLTRELHKAGYHLTIETAGTVHRPVRCDLMSISPKLGNSTPTLERAGEWQSRHNRARRAPQVIQQFLREYEYQLKFVIDRPDDCQEVLEYLSEFPQIIRDRVLLMPQGTSLEELDTRAKWLEPICHQEGFVFCPRKQIEWFGCTRGT